MHPRLKFLSLASVTVVFSLSSPLNFAAWAQESPPAGIVGSPAPMPTSPIPVPAPIPAPSPAPIPSIIRPGMETGSPSTIPIPDAIPSFSPSLSPIPNVAPNGFSRQPWGNNATGNVLSIEIPCYELVENTQKKLEICQKFLALHQKMGDAIGEGATLNNIGLIYFERGNYQQALNFYQQALTIYKQLDNRAGEGATLNNMGLAHYDLGNYAQALTSYQQALTIHRETRNPTHEARTLNNLGELYRKLGQYSQALAFYQQVLQVVNANEDHANVGNTFHNMGLVYDQQGNYAQALEFYQKALAIRQEIGDQLGKGITLNNMGLIYGKQGQHSQALDSLNRALKIFQRLDSRPSIGNTLDSIGDVYKSLGDYSSALEFYQQALTLLRTVGNRGIERVTLGNIAAVLEKQNQPELAIIFYKQSINITEAIRKDLRGLTREQQQSYTNTVAETYRSLADLLLKQNRILEAQQVLDLLKVQELQDYLHNVRGNEQTSQGIELLTQERRLIADFTGIQDRAIALGQELTKLQNIPEANRTPAQQQRIAELVGFQEKITAEFNAFIRSPEVQALTQELSQMARERNVSLRSLKNIQDNLQRMGKGTVLLYPLILKDRLELILTTPDSPPILRTVAVKREELNRAIIEFRSALQTPNSNVAVPAQKLYDWIIKPLENDLIQAEAKTLIYAPDAQLRYIPIAALHDGKEWLIQRFRINHITADSLTDFNTKPQAKPRALAAAFTSGRYNFTVGNRQFSFAGLPFAAREIENLVTTLPNSTKLLDQEFSRDATIPRLNNYNIVHFATHAAFVVGQPDDSFILFGNGDRVALPDVENWRLTNVDLVVLSACETGLGGNLGNGEEILGFGYLMQEAGAKAAIASLWQVSDGGTQALMDVFYATLQKGNITKAEALRQAQIALITSNDTVLSEQRGIGVQQRARNSLSPNITNRLNHPYYWAPFILIGNGL